MASYPSQLQTGLASLIGGVGSGFSRGLEGAQQRQQQQELQDAYLKALQLRAQTGAEAGVEKADIGAEARKSAAERQAEASRYRTDAMLQAALLKSLKGKEEGAKGAGPTGIIKPETFVKDLQGSIKNAQEEIVKRGLSTRDLKEGQLEEMNRIYRVHLGPVLTAHNYSAEKMPDAFRKGEMPTSFLGIPTGTNYPAEYHPDFSKFLSDPVNYSPGQQDKLPTLPNVPGVPGIPDMKPNSLQPLISPTDTQLNAPPATNSSGSAAPVGRPRKPLGSFGADGAQ